MTRSFLGWSKGPKEPMAQNLTRKDLVINWRALVPNEVIIFLSFLDRAVQKIDEFENCLYQKSFGHEIIIEILKPISVGKCGTSIK